MGGWVVVVGGWVVGGSSIRPSKCSTSSSISSSADLVPFGQMIFLFKLALRVPT